MNSEKFRTVNEYLATITPEKRSMLEELRQVIIKAAPKAEEVINYNMPAYKMNRVLVYFAAGKNHIGFYPTPNPIKVFSKELSKYKTSKGASQFPLDKPIPKKLVSDIVKFRIKEDTVHALKSPAKKVASKK